MKAAAEGHGELITVLVGLGAEVKLCDDRGSDAMLWAASSGQLEAVTALSEAGASLETRNDAGETPLLAAASSGHTVRAAEAFPSASQT
eukprot:3313267-Prymnesium_polylepis.1